MSEVIDYVDRLSQVIGPRPAGTEEEQQAAFFIEETLRQTADLSPEIEEFNCNPSFELPRVVCCIATAVLGILSIFLELMVFPSVIITVITALLFITDTLGVSIFSRFGNHGISQNVVARYIPRPTGDDVQPHAARKRKIVVVAHYDSGRVRSEAKGALLGALSIIYWIEIAGMALVPIALLLRMGASADLTLIPILNVILVIGVVASLLPVFGYIMHQTAPYNNAANVNASGTALLMDIARRVNVELPELASDQAVIHGEEAALEAGVIPEGVQLIYDTQPTGSLDPVVPGQTEGAFASAAALSAAQNGEGGESVFANPAAAGDASQTNSYFDQSADTATAAAATPATAVTPQIAEAIGAASVTTAAHMAQAQDGMGASAGTNVVTTAVEENVPDWYRKARQKANKSQVQAAPSQRSRFADALDTAEAVSANALEREAEETTSAPSAAEQRLQQMRASIMSDFGATAAPTPTRPTHAGQGVDGYLASTMAESSYGAEMVANEARSAADAAQVAAQAAAQATVASTQAANFAQTAASMAEVEASAQAGALTPEQAAVADRTISFIPVAVDHDEILRESAQLKEEATAMPEAAPTGRKKRTIALPSLTGAIEGVNARLQEAPLAEENTDEQAKVDNRRARQEMLSSSLPQMSGQPADAAEDAYDQINVAAAGSFVSADATTSFSPVGDELIADMDAQDIYIEDADDSAYTEQFTSAGAPVGPGYVDIPSTRRSKMFGRFRRKKHNDDEMSLQQAIGVDDSFDARSVGAARGGWESFRQDDGEEDEWRGGGFSRKRKTVTATDDDIYAEEFDDMGEEGYDVAVEEVEEAPVEHTERKRSHRHNPEEEGSEGRRRRRDRSANPFGDLPLLHDIAEEREAIQQFNTGMISTEVWFVALGAEIANNAGIASFIDAHHDELRGSIVIDLDGLGAGTLSLIEEEGLFKRTKVSSRMKRYITKAASSLGTHVGNGRMVWRNSGAYYAARKGFQVLHLAGMQDGKPAYACEADDVVENVSEEMLEANAAFVMEVLRNI